MKRTFTFDVLERCDTFGNLRKVEGAKWFNLAVKMAKAGTVSLTKEKQVWCGYGNSPYITYNRYTYTVTEK